MALSHLHAAQNFYEFLFTNSEEEEVEYGANSTASQFQASCNIDMNPLIFLKSTNVEAGLAMFSVNSTPLCFRHGEQIKFYIETPDNILLSNTRYFPIKFKQLQINQTPYIIETNDFCATHKQEPIAYLNNILTSRINNYLLYRTTITFFDMDIFKQNIFETKTYEAFTLGDLQLISDYTYITTFTRLQYLRTLALHIPPITLPELVFNEEYSPLTKTLENEIISDSKVLKSLEDRKGIDDKKAMPPLINFKDFYNVDLANPTTARDRLIERLSEHYIAMLGLALIDLENLSPDDIAFLTALQQSHIKLIKQAKSIRQILTIEHTRLSQAPNPDIFQADFLRIEVASNRAKFLINNSFLPEDETKVRLIFPELVSYTLGTKTQKERIKIGDISHDTVTDGRSRPKFTTDITSQNDKLYSPIKYSPSVLHITTDLLAGNSIFKTLPDKRYSNFNIIHSEKITEQTLDSGFIFKTPNEIDYHPVLRSFNILTRVRIMILDNYFHKVFFPLKTQVNASIKFRSTATND